MWYAENIILADLQHDVLPSVGYSLLHGLLCFGLNSIFTNALLSLQKYFISHMLSAAIQKTTPVMQKYKAGHKIMYARS